MNNNDIPVWEKYTLTIEEASKYFRIGENKLRRLAEENKDAGWLIMNGNRKMCIRDSPVTSCRRKYFILLLYVVANNRCNYFDRFHVFYSSNHYACLLYTSRCV